MASSSSSSRFWNHNVFLSFRGGVTSETFVDHLYSALERQRIDTFKDADSLPRGIPIVPSVLKTIEESQIAVVIFSKNYARSSWRLTELTLIIECKRKTGQIVYPIFFDVDRSHVRKQSGEFREAFGMHKRKNSSKVESWRKALADSANLPGWDYKHHANGSDSEFIEKIVDTIRRTLKANQYLMRLRSVRSRDCFYTASKQITTLMASSLSSSHSTVASSSRLWNHDVFLSFRGEDTRKTFVGHLYSALEKQGIHTFKDDKILERGESIGQSLLKAIKESLIAVIVFSEHYASSSFCLDELITIMECMTQRGQIVFPIFYNVNAYDVRKQTGKIGEEFAQHEPNNSNKVMSWRYALKELADISGWGPKHMANRGESQCITEIVDTISRRLKDVKKQIGKQNVTGVDENNRSPIEELEHMQIPLEDILFATRGFDEENKIAQGGFGRVYRGQSQQLGAVAVKRLDRGSDQGQHEFMMEIALLSTYKHENLVSLVGYCDESDEKILVYKHESNGSLDKFLHRKDLTWMQRLRICLDAACGLEYLHDGVGLEHRVLHRDIKSSNILLDENWKAKISDFGLSKLGPANVRFTFLISNACGTLGYIDPEYLERGILTQKSDVYSFGVVLFEVLCGRPACVLEYDDERHFLFRLAQNHYEKKTLDKIIDSDLLEQMDSTSSSIFSTIAYQCLRKRGVERPTMSAVVGELEKALDYQKEAFQRIRNRYP